ncbi:MAG: hypothetical protein KKG00_03935, partial [Bacteroidetes bacterium]|nr:hypothetical protein [Bacteroidota bacterium]
MRQWELGLDQSWSDPHPASIIGCLLYDIENYSRQKNNIKYQNYTRNIYIFVYSQDGYGILTI